MSFEDWLVHYSLKISPEEQRRREAHEISREMTEKFRVYPKADLESLNLNYNEKAQLGLADVEPKGILLETFK